MGPLLDQPLRESFLKRHSVIAAIAGLLTLGGAAASITGGFAKSSTVGDLGARVDRLEVRAEYLEKSSTWQNVAVFELARRQGVSIAAPPPAPSPHPVPLVTSSSSP